MKGVHTDRPTSFVSLQLAGSSAPLGENMGLLSENAGGHGGEVSEGNFVKRSTGHLARSLTFLNSALERARSAADDDRAAAFDHAAARLVEAAQACGAAPSVLLPAQRTLLLLGGRPRRASIPDSQTLAQALDAFIVGPHEGPQQGGFARLLQSAIDAGEVDAVEEISVEDVADDEGPLFLRVQAMVRRLNAIDDLTHALDVRPSFPAALVVADQLIRLILAPDDVEDSAKDVELDEDIVHLTCGWLSHRGVNQQLLDVVTARDSQCDMSVELQARTDAMGVGQARALSLWILADQLANRLRPTIENRAAWVELFRRASLVPLEVFETADLWLDLDR